MTETRLTHLQIPSTIAESIHLLDVPAAPVKLALLAESEREDGVDHVSIPVGRVRAMAGWTNKTLHGSIKGLQGLRARWVFNADDPGAAMPEAWSPFVESPRAEYDGDDERVVVRFSREWLTACRGPRIAFPLDDLRAFRRRAAVLLRLRMEAALHGRETVRMRYPLSDLAMLSGRGADLDPAAHLLPDIVRGMQEVCEVSTTMSVNLDILTSRLGKAVHRDDPDVVVREGRTRAVVVTARRLRPRGAAKAVDGRADEARP